MKRLLWLVVGLLLCGEVRADITQSVGGGSSLGDDLTVSTFTVTGTIIGTIDDTSSGLTHKGYGYITLTHPHSVDGSNTTFVTTPSSATYGQGRFSNSTDSATNFVEYRLTVPEDLDTTVDLILSRFDYTLSAADTAAHTYHISMTTVTTSSSRSGTPFNSVTLTGAADASGADADTEQISGNTLTSWKSFLTPGAFWIIRLGRDGDSDASTVNSFSGSLTLRYGYSQ